MSDNGPRAKHALVTGGGTGVGAAIALAFAGAGVTVTICGRRSSAVEEIAARHNGIVPMTADVTDERSVDDLFRTASDHSGPADIVVANAGSAESAPLARTDLDLFRRMVEVNLTGVFLTLKRGMRDMSGLGWGRVLAVASTAGLKGYPYVAAYCAAKHGVVGLTRALAVETAGSGITVNALCPGFTDTPMLDASVAAIVAQTGKSEAEVRRTLAAANPMGRLVRPDEVAAAALWLIGPGSDAVTGQVIPVCCGETA